MGFELKKVSDFVYEIGKEQSKGMNVPVRIFANDNVIKVMGKDRTLSQAVNTASLPSIVDAMLVMPDGHEGYSVPIGGVAAFPSDGGIISPGAIGFDINCLHKDSRVLNRFGAWERISAISSDSVRIYDRTKSIGASASVLLSMKKGNEGKILRIKTKHGKELAATADHPILTDEGMVRMDHLEIGKRVMVTGFEGVEFSKAKDSILASADALGKALDDLGITSAGHAKTQIMNKLKRLGFVDLRLTDPKVPVLLKVMGLIFGDGTIPKTTLIASIYGKREDLEDVKADLFSIGVKSAIYSRKRHCRITTRYGTQAFENEEYSLHVSSRAFGVLMAVLGVPLGNKTIQAYTVPDWIKKAEGWQKRLFLAAYFGAEMTKPITNNGYNFMTPTVGINKLESLAYNAKEFLQDLKEMLQSLSIECSPISRVEGYAYDGKYGRTIGHRLQVLSNTSNLIKFFSTVSYEYCKAKATLASLATLYLNWLLAKRELRNHMRYTAIAMHNSGRSTEGIIQTLQVEKTDASFIEHSVWGRNGDARIWKQEHFEEFSRASHISEGFVLDEIIEITEEPYDGYVYDITVGDPNHDFIANGIVVSNCGVRLIRTNLKEEDVRPKLPQLMDRLFNNVPSGVGSKISLGFTRHDLERVATEGVPYIISKGFGFEDDADRTEETGVMEGANPDKVSDLAKKRGVSQLGTLGAGNHFLEVQKVEQIMDKGIAEAFALEKDQVVVMLHSGSRGYGHQVCSDYLRTFEEYRIKEHITLPDPELLYAYIGSKEADNYLAAMRSAVNFAFVNRQIMTHLVRKSFTEVFGKSADALGMELVYDVAHNIAKLEEHTVEGKRTKLYVHRKGATRAFGPGNEAVPKIYRDVGQPVLIPGSMGTASYVLAGRQEAMEESFGSSCHGSGRLMSRHQAIRDIPVSKTMNDLASKHVEVRVRSRKLISEEAAWAYKNVDDVVASVAGAKISNIVARLVPLGVAKG